MICYIDVFSDVATNSPVGAFPATAARFLGIISEAILPMEF